MVCQEGRLGVEENLETLLKDGHTGLHWWQDDGCMNTRGGMVILEVGLVTLIVVLVE